MTSLLRERNSNASESPSAFGGVWIVIPIFNRRDTSLRCLQNLDNLGVLSIANVVVCDGGSTDGSSQAIALDFPQVTVLSGQWWWMEGVRAGMEYARAFSPEIYVWLNDDCLPRPGSFEALIENSRNTGYLSGGITYTEDLPYAGMLKNYWGLAPTSIPSGICVTGIIAADCLQGNFVAIPSSCVETIGLPDATLFPHLCGDSYYTLEASLHGFRCEIVGAAIADDSHGGNSASAHSILTGSKSWTALLADHFKIDPRFGILPEFRLFTKFWGIRGWLIVGSSWTINLSKILIKILVPRSVIVKARSMLNHGRLP
jgi:Glycosyl transferase family 2